MGTRTYTEPDETRTITWEELPDGRVRVTQVSEGEATRAACDASAHVAEIIFEPSPGYGLAALEATLDARGDDARIADVDEALTSRGIPHQLNSLGERPGRQSSTVGGRRGIAANRDLLLAIYLKEIEDSASLDASRRFYIYRQAYEAKFGHAFTKGFGAPEDDEACVSIMAECLKSGKPYAPSDIPPNALL